MYFANHSEPQTTVTITYKRAYISYATYVTVDNYNFIQYGKFEAVVTSYEIITRQKTHVMELRKKMLNFVSQFVRSPLKPD